MLGVFQYFKDKKDIKLTRNSIKSYFTLFKYKNKNLLTIEKELYQIASGKVILSMHKCNENIENDFSSTFAHNTFFLCFLERIGWQEVPLDCLFMAEDEGDIIIDIGLKKYSETLVFSLPFDDRNSIENEVIHNVPNIEI
jgi:hypothetical protein